MVASTFLFHGFISPSKTINSVFISKVEEAVESLSREILTIQAKGDKEAADLLLQKYCKMTRPLKHALEKLECSGMGCETLLVPHRTCFYLMRARLFSGMCTCYL
jgi:hypothetical protein